MKVLGIIAEYNPFHNGHKYQIDTLKQQTGADYVIIAMSGDFVQRGAPAICDKYTRAQMALSGGADLVLELPSLWATASAEYFARGGITLLNNTGVVTHLGFGAETGNIEYLKAISSILLEEPDTYREVLSMEQKAGHSFPTARTAAIRAVLPDFPEDHIREILSSPNNILAMEYLKALENTSNITPVLLKREGAAYHCKNIESSFASATAIRQALQQGAAFREQVPETSYTLLKSLESQNGLIFSRSFSSVLGYNLLSKEKEGYEAYADCDKDLSDKIKKHLYSYMDYHSFCHLLKSKDLTFSRISRVLLHILLGITKDDYLAYDSTMAPYLRILGFRKDATPLLNRIKQEGQSPLISKMADASSVLSHEAMSLLEKDIYASNLYHQILGGQQMRTPANEFTRQIIIQ